MRTMPTMRTNRTRSSSGEECSLGTTCSFQCDWPTTQSRSHSQTMGAASCPFPERHVVEYEVLVENAYDVEQEVHRRLANVHYKKEFFRCPVSVAVAAIRTVVGGTALYESA